MTEVKMEHIVFFVFIAFLFYYLIVDRYDYAENNVEEDHCTKTLEELFKNNFNKYNYKKCMDDIGDLYSDSVKNACYVNYENPDMPPVSLEKIRKFCTDYNVNCKLPTKENPYLCCNGKNCNEYNNESKFYDYKCLQTQEQKDEIMQKYGWSASYLAGHSNPTGSSNKGGPPSFQIIEDDKMRDIVQNQCYWFKK